ALTSGLDWDVSAVRVLFNSVLRH
ncbi:MAG: hypothetical protein RL696_404, partial [Actinomycetota bacterium]